MIPASTYRLQITPDFTLHDAAPQLDYLQGLGVDWVYLSPLLDSAGSEHGYDVVDPARMDEARGGRAGLEALASAAHARGMGVMVDIVPNHMGIARPEVNPYWWDVLAHGPQSQFVNVFDIDWDAGDGKIILPELGDPGDLDQLRITEHHGQPALELYGKLYPVAHGTYAEGISPQHLHAAQNYRFVPWQNEDWELNYRRFFTIRTLAGVRVEDPEVFALTHRQIASWFADGLVDGLRIDHIDGLADPAGYLERLCELTGAKERSRSGHGAYVVVEKILSLGPKDERELLPAEWQTAGTTGYELIAYIDGALTHLPGFFQLEALRQHLSVGGMLDEASGLDIAGSGKRLQRHPTAVTGVLHQIEGDAKAHFTAGPLSAEMLRLARDAKAAWDDLNEETRSVIGSDPLAGTDVEQLADVFALLAASLPVYRVYEPQPQDRDWFLADFTGSTESLPEMSAGARIVRAALARVRSTARSTVASDSLLSYIGVLLTTTGNPVCIRFGQTTGAVTAKGVEDTALYRYAALTALNEVGGSPADPHSPAVLSAEFHRRAKLSPAGLNSLTTHDTKRGEDTRARILSIAEVAGEFAQFLARARELCPLAFDAGAPEVTAGIRAFGVNESLSATRPTTRNTSFEILVWQAVLGAWPIDSHRIRDYVLKAAREAAEQTSWTQPDRPFEQSVDVLARACESDPTVRALIADFDSRIRHGGASNGVVAKALQLLAPGVPDVYNGSELWDQSLVDPDNRRPVDFAARRELLASLPPVGRFPTAEFFTEEASWASGAVKLALTRALLHLRQDLPELFAQPAPEPLRAAGPLAAHVIGFALGERPDVVVVGTRLPITLQDAGGWDEGTVVSLPPRSDADGQAAGTRRWRDVVTGIAFDASQPIALAKLLRLLPVAVLRAED